MMDLEDQTSSADERGLAPMQIDEQNELATASNTGPRGEGATVTTTAAIMLSLPSQPQPHGWGAVLSISGLNLYLWACA